MISNKIITKFIYLVILNIFNQAKEIIPKHRFPFKEGFVEIAAWSVPKSACYTEGIKYSFAYIKDNVRILAIDNYNHEGHHIHMNNKKVRYQFINLKQTEELFYELINNDKNQY